MKKTILITGANGFIGNFLVEGALERDYEVYAGVRKSADLRYLTDKRIRFFTLDFSKEFSLKNIPKFNYIIHNAGLTKANKKEDYFRVNYLYTKQFINELIVSNKVPEKFIYMSSLAAYGPGNPDGTEIKINDKPCPITTYGISKLQSEKFINELNNFPYLIFRPTAVYGPKEKDLFTFLKLINRNVEPYISPKDQQLTFIYVKDLAKAIFMGIESKKMNKSYFVSDGNTYSARVLGGLIKRGLGKKTISFSVPPYTIHAAGFLLEKIYGLSGKTPTLNSEKIRELTALNWKCDIGELKSDLEFKPDYDLNRGISETVNWYKKEKWL